MHPDDQASARYKFFVATVMAAVLAMALLWLQRLFDQGDIRRAQEIALALRPGGEQGESVGAALRARTGAPQSCTGEIRSSCAGYVRVTCAGYAFDVALVARAVNPANAPALELVQSLAKPAPAQERR